MAGFDFWSLFGMTNPFERSQNQAPNFPGEENAPVGNFSGGTLDFQGFHAARPFEEQGEPILFQSGEEQEIQTFPDDTGMVVQNARGMAARRGDPSGTLSNIDRAFTIKNRQGADIATIGPNQIDSFGISNQNLGDQVRRDPGMNIESRMPSRRDARDIYFPPPPDTTFDTGDPLAGFPPEFLDWLYGTNQDHDHDDHSVPQNQSLDDILNQFIPAQPAIWQQQQNQFGFGGTSQPQGGIDQMGLLNAILQMAMGGGGF